MSTSRRHFLAQTVAAMTGAAVFSRPVRLAAAEQPSSLYRGVQLGTITYSYRSMPDQSVEALLRYIVESGISAIELMGAPAEAFAGAPADPAPDFRRFAFLSAQGRLNAAEQRAFASMQPAHEEHLQALRAWRASASMDGFRALRSMYERAGVRIYAFKPDAFGATNTDEEVAYGFRAAQALGATHCTTELPDDPAESLRLGSIAAQSGLVIAYHTHEQASLDVFDAAFRQSSHNASNIDLGHYVAAPKGGDPLAFLRKHHARIASVHLKDRQTPAHGGGNLAWGMGDTPLRDILRLIRDEGYDFPVTIELEYEVPAGSNAVKEVGRCLDFCKSALDG